MRPAWSPGCSDCVAWAAKRKAFSRAARLTLSDTSKRKRTLSRSTQRGTGGPPRPPPPPLRERPPHPQPPAPAGGKGHPDPPAGLPPPVEEALQREHRQ